MNIPTMKSKAAAGTGFTRNAFVRRVAAAGLVGLAVMSSAMADPGRNQRGGGGGWQFDAMRQGPVMQQQQQQRQYEDRRYDDRQQRQYEERMYQQRLEDERRRAQDRQQNSNQEFRRSGRLTPDERRDLRRQINEAGADIYQRQRRR